VSAQAGLRPIGGAMMRAAVPAAVLATVLATVLAGTVACSRSAQPPASVPASEPPAANLGAAWGDKLTKLPDWTGQWFVTDGLSFPGKQATVAVKDPAQDGGFSYGELPGTYFTGAPYKPEYQKIYDERVRLARDEFKVYDPMSSCVVPHGMPRIIGGGPGPTEFIVTPEQTTIIWDYMNEMRRIYTDGRPHPAPGEFQPTVMGHSIGHWDGQTLLVDTTFMKNGIYDRSGAPHSNQVHVVEHIRSLDRNTIEFQLTIEDPVTFTKPWNVTRTYRRMGPRGSAPLEIEGSYCENHRNPVGEGGQTAILGSEEASQTP
jgi:hypothetical protein